MAPTLYYCIESAPSRIALMTARALKVDINIQNVDWLKRETMKQEFVTMNPQHCVPTLDDDGFILWESHAIAKYFVSLHDHDHKLYPKEPKAAAIVERLLYFDVETMFACLRKITFPIFFAGEKKISQEKRDEMNEAFRLLDMFLKNNTWTAGGSSFTLADIAISATTSNIVMSGWDMSSFPNILRWLKSCEIIPGFDENLKGARRFGEALKSKVDPGELLSHEISY